MNIQPVEPTTFEQLLPKMNNYPQFDEQKGFSVILAGGEDLPNQWLMPKSLRGRRPPQFCRKAGGDFLINQTRELVATGFPSYKILFTVTETDSRYYEDILADVPTRNLIVQPQNDGTTFEILYAAMRLAKINPNAVIVFFPADFTCSEPRAFMKTVESAFLEVIRKPQLILIGIETDNFDPQSSWLEPDYGRPINENLNLWRVRNSSDNPSDLPLSNISNRGFLPNSSVMVGTAATFLRKIRRSSPDIYSKFAAVKSKIGTPDEQSVIRNIYYSNFSQTDFARDVLKKSTDELAVIPVSDLASVRTQDLEKAELVGFVS